MSASPPDAANIAEAPLSASDGASALAPGKRRPATGPAQLARQAWGRTWGAIMSEAAKQRKETET